MADLEESPIIWLPTRREVQEYGTSSPQIDDVQITGSEIRDERKETQPERMLEFDPLLLADWAKRLKS